MKCPDCGRYSVATLPFGSFWRCTNPACEVEATPHYFNPLYLTDAQFFALVRRREAVGSTLFDGLYRRYVRGPAPTRREASELYAAIQVAHMGGAIVRDRT